MFAKSMSDFLVDNNFGVLDVDIFINNLPSRVENSNVICIYDVPSYSIRSRERNSVDFNCQIRVRNDKNSKASKIAFDIYNLLEKGAIKDSTGKRFTIRPLNPPSFLMYDEAGRVNWILNVTALSLNY